MGTHGGVTHPHHHKAISMTNKENETLLKEGIASPGTGYESRTTAMDDPKSTTN